MILVNQSLVADFTQLLLTLLIKDTTPFLIIIFCLKIYSLCKINSVSKLSCKQTVRLLFS